MRFLGPQFRGIAGPSLGPVRALNPVRLLGAGVRKVQKEVEEEGVGSLIFLFLLHFSLTLFQDSPIFLLVFLQNPLNNVYYGYFRSVFALKALCRW